MRQSVKFLLIIAIFSLLSSNAYGGLKGGVDYTIPIDYSEINQTELEGKAETYYQNAVKSKSTKLNSDITNALNLYGMLSGKYPENITYIIRLGKLYDMIGKDRYAKGNYSRAAGLEPQNPEPYFCLGNYYFKREQYRKALKMYKKASELGYSKNAENLEKLDILYRMLGEKSAY